MRKLRSRGLRARRLRAALPSSLVGLVTFSFVVLGLGTAVYTAALPSLVEESPVVEKAVEAARSSVDGAASDAGSSSGSPSDAGKNGSDEKDSSSKASGKAGTGKASAASIKGLGKLSASAKKQSGAQDEKDASKEDDSTSESDEKKADEKSKGDDSGSSSGQKAGSGGDSPSGDDPGSSSGGQDEPDPQEDPQEESARAWILGQYQAVQVATGTISSLNAQMEENFLGSMDTRLSCERNAAAQYSGLYAKWRTAVNGTPKTNLYGSQVEDVIGMWRCLFQASEVVYQAWGYNVAYEDASASQAELTSLYDEAAAAEQGYLDQYYRYAENFSL